MILDLDLLPLRRRRIWLHREATSVSFPAEESHIIMRADSSRCCRRIQEVQKKSIHHTAWERRHA